MCVCVAQLQAKLSRVQVLATNGDAGSDSRDSFHDSDTASDADVGGEKSDQVGPKCNMSLLDQHSKLKLEALGNLLVCCKILQLWVAIMKNSFRNSFIMLCTLQFDVSNGNVNKASEIILVPSVLPFILLGHPPQRIMG